MRRQIWAGLTVAGLALSLAGCEWWFSFGSDDDDDEGRLTLALADAPIDDLTALTVTVLGVELKPVGDDSVTFVDDAPREIDLLSLQNGTTATLIDDEDVPADDYDWVRLILSDDGDAHTAEGRDGGTYSVVVPASFESGLRVDADFSLDEGDAISLTLDFDVRRSLYASSGVAADYELRPTLRLVENGDVGAIVGTVDSSTLIQTACDSPQDYAGLVYVYEGGNVTPNDLGGVPEPMVTAVVSDADNPGTYTYYAGLLPAGDYTVSYSCDRDDLEVDESLSFRVPVSVAVRAGVERELNLDGT
ncbi:DUF4382 domain-containing protein [Marinobacter bohaiensis]|uniref:DUF4382 domain-containing protein n=1 Tax=Marinobacter bohaiensis TaxID=2201898 RepID=UPI000DADE859|nr:DUF4382 domain-containing protein [Marinobacter bohaiensis]